MATINMIFSVIKWIFYAIWGMIVIDIIPMIVRKGAESLELFNNFENAIKIITAVIGFVYFAKNIYDYIFIELPYKKKKYNLETRIMQEDLESKETSNGKESKKKVVIPKFYGFTVTGALKHVF
jgi:hypothetical protein